MGLLGLITMDISGQYPRNWITVGTCDISAVQLFPFPLDLRMCSYFISSPTLYFWEKVKPYIEGCLL